MITSSNSRNNNIDNYTFCGLAGKEKKKNERMDIEMREIREKKPHSCAVLRTHTLSPLSLSLYVSLGSLVMITRMSV
jgi:hypothetical protein